LSDGTELKFTKWTDIDVVSQGTLWQLKVGSRAIDNPGEIESWLRQAAEAIRAKSPSTYGANKVGLKLDEANAKLFGVNANGDFIRDTNYKKVLDRVRAEYGDIEFDIKITNYPYP
jgi:hypothetical protein